jgi:hypothetical protein
VVEARPGLAPDASQGQAARAVPWSERLALRLCGSPLRLSLAIGAILLALFLAVEAALGRLALALATPWRAQSDLRFALLIIAMVAYLPGAYAVGTRGARRTIEELLPALRGEREERARLAAGAGRYSAAPLRRAGLAGTALLLLVPLAVDQDLGTYVLWRFHPEPIFLRLLLPVAGWFVGRFFYAVYAESRRLSRIGRELLRVDLLDPRPAAPLARQGLRYALLTIGIGSIISLFFLDPDLRPADRPGMIPVLLAAHAAIALLAGLALALPARGAREAIRAAKRAELDWCDAALRRAREGAGGHGLADLVAWRGLVESAREWPFDAPTLLRFALYLGIPLGSWLGGALVERVLDALLG